MHVKRIQVILRKGYCLRVKTSGNPPGREQHAIEISRIVIFLKAWLTFVFQGPKIEILVLSTNLRINALQTQLAFAFVTSNLHQQVGSKGRIVAYEMIIF